MEPSVEAASSESARRRSTHLSSAAEKEEKEGEPEPELEPKKKPSHSSKRLGRSMEERQNLVFREMVNYEPTPLPVRNYDKNTSEPVSFYLSSLEELLAWIPNSDDAFNIAMIPLAARQPSLQSERPRTLLCHDMMGGYLDDRFIQGSMKETPYTFYHWQFIDIFVYFSHHTVTIPPVGWTNAAHKHGVCVLGTLITEWTEGGRLCEKFLSGNPSSYQKVADQLVRIAQFFHFDGWLINIENQLSMAAVKNTPSFLRYLTDQLHQYIPDGLVIWYDSVVKDGQLKWQNELNESNRIFFDSCDGLFTNYNWKEAHLERMASVEKRKADVYVGVDIFARGNVVGGGFDTNKEETLGPWYHLSAQEIQPIFGDHIQENGSGWLRIHSCLMDAWNGGSSLLVRGMIPVTTGKVTMRLFSLQVLAPPKLFLSLTYKLEGRTDIAVALELSTLDVGRCNIGDISSLHAEPSIRHTPRPLQEPPAKLLGWVDRCNQQFNGGWIRRCYEVNLQNCFLQDIFVNFSRPLGSQKDENFTCRLGEIQVVDADSLMTPLPQVRDITASHTCWQQIHSERNRFKTKLLLSCTLRWSYPISQACCFRVYHLGGSCSRRQELLKSEEPTFLGLAHASMYRVVNLVVEEAPAGQECFVDFLIQPVPKEGFLVPQAEWGSLTLLYSKPNA
ncbi:cytosolic endo-beta-N-acetylglucosaminidase isoform X4 [Monodelphis domestica]|uniref:cytosolic endo-beta-N-acetylglucosaminidase isoform X4 n=1 Tax=Monodelphis domestica TaxID=13616 RepID=UPI0024E1EF48|nr:cytosolic endo-beta-N-acetylglucosaminidase isoform X4 [Monodelphis domestica]